MLLGRYVAKAHEKARRAVERKKSDDEGVDVDDVSWPVFSRNEARQDPYDYLRNEWGLRLADVDQLAIANDWWHKASDNRIDAYLQEGIVTLIKNDGHTVCKTSDLLEWCMLELRHTVSMFHLRKRILAMLDGESFTGLYAYPAENQEAKSRCPEALAYAPVYQIERNIAFAVNELRSVVPPVHQEEQMPGTVEPTPLFRNKLTEGFLEKAILPDDVQWGAIFGMYNSGLSVLQGPAGTGKTAVVLSTLVRLIRLTLPDACNSCDSEDDRVDDDTNTTPPQLIIGTAPTHNAVQRLNQEIGSCLDDCKTLSSLLYMRERSWKKCKLANMVQGHSTVTVIVDESSMVDIYLWGDLFHVLHELTLEGRCVRCILAGDHQQLPPVGTGAVFEDLCKSNAVSVFRLEKIYRQEAESILKVAELYTSKCPTMYWTMRKGFVCPILKQRDEHVTLMSVDSAAATCTEKDGERRRRALENLLSALKKLELVLSGEGYDRSRIQLVTFTNEACYVLQSLWETGSTNDAVALIDGSPHKLPERFNWKIGAKTRFKKNSVHFFKNNDDGIIVEAASEKEMELGREGCLCVKWEAIDPVDASACEPEESPVKHFEEGKSGEFRFMVTPATICPSEARTIHSTQGAGFDVIIYVLLRPSVLLTANGHYTAITRARKRVCLLGDLAAFSNTAARSSSVRRTLLPSILAAVQRKPPVTIEAKIQLLASELENVLDSARTKSNSRKQIGKAVRYNVWNEYIGEDKRDGPCSVCKRTIKLEYMHVAHVIAVANGGTNHYTNLRPCCHLCNLSMGTRNLEEFRREHFD